jgi:hypothetical protein
MVNSVIRDIQKKYTMKRKEKFVQAQTTYVFQAMESIATGVIMTTRKVKSQFEVFGTRNSVVKLDSMEKH